VKSSRGLRGLAVLAVASAFLAGPTPGDIGGCGGSLANSPLPGSAAQQEYDYFEQGFCANLCLRLRSCGVLCRAIAGATASCNNDSREAYQQCLRGNLRRDIFRSDMCPHSCGNYPPGRFIGASEIDVQTCGRAVQAISCTAIADVITSPPDQCLAVCGL
jgi:hypothetical protein